MDLQGAATLGLKGAPQNVLDAQTAHATNLNRLNTANAQFGLWSKERNDAISAAALSLVAFNSALAGWNPDAKQSSTPKTLDSAAATPAVVSKVAK